MPYHLKKQSLMQAIGTVYYTGDNRWSNVFSERMIYENKSPIRLFLSFKRLFVMIFGFIFLIVYKNIYQYLLMLDLNLLFEASTDFDLILSLEITS